MPLGNFQTLWQPLRKILKKIHPDFGVPLGNETPLAIFARQLPSCQKYEQHCPPECKMNSSIIYFRVYGVPGDLASRVYRTGGEF